MATETEIISDMEEKEQNEKISVSRYSFSSTVKGLDTEDEKDEPNITNNIKTIV